MLEFAHKDMSGRAELLAGDWPEPGGTLLGIGAAPGALGQACAFLMAWPERVRVMAINASIASWPCGLDFAATMHPAFLRSRPSPAADIPWLTARELAGRPMPGHVFGPDAHEGVTVRMNHDFAVASSGMLPVLVGRFVLGCERVVLAGVDLSAPGYAEVYLPLWRKASAIGLLDNVHCVTPGPVAELCAPLPANFSLSLPTTPQAGGSGALPLGTACRSGKRTGGSAA